MTVEYLLALDSGIWTTHIVEVPLESNDRETLLRFAEDNLGVQAGFRNVLVWGLMRSMTGRRRHESDAEDRR